MPTYVVYGELAREPDNLVILDIIQTESPYLAYKLWKEEPFFEEQKDLLSSPKIRVAELGKSMGFTLEPWLLGLAGAVARGLRR